MSGFDHDFLFRAGAKDVVASFVRCLERRWGDVVVGDGVEPIDGWSFEEGWLLEPVCRESFHISESSALLHWTNDEGLISDPSGKCVVMILFFPNEDGTVQLDLVTAEEWKNADADNTWISDIFEDLFQAIAESHRHVTDDKSEMCLRVHSDIDWLVRSISALVPSDWNVRAEGVKPARGEEGCRRFVLANSEGSVVGDMDVRRDDEMTVLSVSKWGRTVTRDEREMLQKAIYRSVAMWHHVYYVDEGDPQLAVYSWPPGELELVNGCVEIRGPGRIREEKPFWLKYP